MDTIYDDLEVVPDIDLEYAKVQEINKELTLKITKLEAEVLKLNELLSSMKKQQQDLEQNISSLYNTAKAECERKDRNIDNLRRQLDNFLFRRDSQTDKRDSSKQSERSDSTRNDSHSSRHTSRSTSPKLENKDIKDSRDNRNKSYKRRVSPRGKSSHDSKHASDYRSNKNVNKQTDSKDLREKLKESKDTDREKDMDRNKGSSSSKRSRNDDRKSPTTKRSRYEDDKHRKDKFNNKNDKYENKIDESDNQKGKPNEPVKGTGNKQASHEKQDKGQKSKDNTSQHKTENKQIDNQNRHKSKKEVKTGKVELIIELINSSIEEGELPDSQELKTNDENSTKLKPQQNVKQNTDKLKADEAQTKDVATNLILPENRTETKTTNNQEVKEAKTNELIEITKDNSKKLNFTGVLDTEIMKKNLFIQKPPAPISATELFGNTPIGQSQSSFDVLAPSPSVSSSNISMINLYQSTSSHFNLNNSMIVDSTHIIQPQSPQPDQDKPNTSSGSNSNAASLSLRISSDSKCLDSSNNSNNDTGIDKENTQHIVAAVVEGAGVQGITVSSPLGVGRGRPRPRRRGGVVKMID